MKTPLRKARDAKQLTLGDLAKLVDSDVGNLSRIERGRQIPSSELAAKICGVFPDSGLTELHLIYPERYEEQQPGAAVIDEGDRRHKSDRRKSSASDRRARVG
jgi:transcriptional regulator with XRE-family HTH domain